MVLVLSLENKLKPTVEGNNLLPIIENHVHDDCEGYMIISQEEYGKEAGIPNTV